MLNKKLFGLPDPFLDNPPSAQPAIIAAREMVARNLVQITRRLACRPDCPGHRFYDTLTYRSSSAYYLDYIFRLKKEKNLTVGELRQIINCLMRCSYDFDCEHDMTFRLTVEPLPGESKPAAIRRNAVIENYFYKRNYEKCLLGIAADPKMLDYALINKIYVKSLFWCGQFAKCNQALRGANRPESYSDPADRIFYYLQRAQCAQHLGKLKQARGDCNAARATDLSTKRNKQLPAILWLRAHLNYELGYNDRALNDLNELERSLQGPDWSFGSPIGRELMAYFDRYKEIIAEEIS